MVVSDVIVPSLAMLLRLIPLYLKRRTHAWTSAPSGHDLVCHVSFNIASKLLLSSGNCAIVWTHIFVYRDPERFGVGPPPV